jgi:hypothetical protein
MTMHRTLVQSVAALIWLALVALVLYPAPHTHEAQAQTYPMCAPELHDASHWHLPYDVAHGCLFDHEHGDAPPQWIMDAGYMVAFDDHGGFHGNTSAAENAAKHPAMKGYLLDVQDYNGGAQQIYFRFHIASNVLDRMARYHSYEVFMKDAAGGVSHWQGWFNSGDPVTDRVIYTGFNDPGRRPIVLVQNEQTFPTAKNEQWYARASTSWNWDFALSVDPTTFYYEGENANTDRSTWRPTGRLGTVRRLEPAWYGPDSHYAASRTAMAPKGVTFYATQLGEIVSGQTDPRCSGTTTAFGSTYPNVCLPQFIATTAKAVEFSVPGGNARDRVFPGIGLGVALPN